MSHRGAILQDYGNYHPLTFEGIDKGAQLLEGQDEANAHLNYLKQKDAKGRQDDATDFISKLKVPLVGDQTVDTYNNQLMANLQSQLNDMQKKGATATDIKMKAMQELPKINQGYIIAKSGYDKLTKGLQDLSKDYPKGNLEAARAITGNSFLHDIFDYNPDGSVKGYKDISLIPQGKSYTGALMQPENIDAWYPKGQQSLVKNIQDTRGLTPIEGKVKETNARGGSITKAYKGHISIYDKPSVNEDGNITGVGLDTESVPLGTDKNGQAILVDVMPKEKFDVLRGSGQSALEFDREFNRHLQEDLGVNPKALDPQAYDVYQRKFAADLLKGTNLQGSSYNKFEEEKAAPIKNITNVKVNNAKDVPVLDYFTPTKTIVDEHFTNKDNYKPIVTGNGVEVYGAVPLNSLDDKYQEAILGIAKSKDPDIKGIGDVFLKKGNDGNPVIVKTLDNSVVAPLTEIGVNIPANKALGVKSKDKAVIQAQGKLSSPKKDPLGLF